jgi:hypothetical protein
MNNTIAKILYCLIFSAGVGVLFAFGFFSSINLPFVGKSGLVSGFSYAVLGSCYLMIHEFRRFVKENSKL